MTTWICEECVGAKCTRENVLESDKPSVCPIIWEDLPTPKWLEVKPEPKRYRLEIPEMIKNDQDCISYQLKLSGKTSVEEGESIHVGPMKDIQFERIPKEWLIPIESEEMTAEKWVSEKSAYCNLKNNPSMPLYTKMDMVDAFNEGVKEGARIEQKKHEP